MNNFNQIYESNPYTSNISDIDITNKKQVFKMFIFTFTKNGE